MTSLKKKTLGGLLWSGINAYGTYFLKFVFSIAIARLLDPEDYGLIGMMAIFTAIATKLADGGFQDALIQKKEPTNEDFSSVFVFKIFITVVMYLILFFSANAIANFYHEPRLVLITKVISLSFVISGLGGIHVAYFVKKIELKTYTKINVSSSILSGIIGVSTAYYGFGYWALIFQTLSGHFIRTASYWIFNKWHPSFRFSFDSMKQLYSFGWKMFAQQMMHTIFANIYYPLIGRLFPVDTLGYFTRAKRFQDLAVLQTWVTFNQVLFPALSSIQDDQERFRKAFTKSFNLMLFFIYPLTTLLIATARPFIELFLTSKWLPVVPYMQLMYITGFIAPFIAFNMNSVNALGRSDITLKLNIIFRLILFLSIVASISFGVIGLIVGQLVTGIISYALSAHVCGRRTHFSLINQLKSIFPVLLISSVAFVSGIALDFILDIHLFVLMFLQTIVVLSVYLILMRIFKPPSYNGFKELVIEHIPNKFHHIL